MKVLNVYLVVCFIACCHETSCSEVMWYAMVGREGMEVALEENR